MNLVVLQQQQQGTPATQVQGQGPRKAAQAAAAASAMQPASGQGPTARLGALSGSVLAARLPVARGVQASSAYTASLVLPAPQQASHPSNQHMGASSSIQQQQRLPLPAMAVAGLTLPPISRRMQVHHQQPRQQLQLEALLPWESSHQHGSSSSSKDSTTSSSSTWAPSTSSSSCRRVGACSCRPSSRQGLTTMVVLRRQLRGRCSRRWRHTSRPPGLHGSASATA